MSELELELQRQFEEQVVVACDRIFSEGVRQMVKAMENSGIVLTGALKNSLYMERTKVTDTYEAQFRMGMQGFGRFKDMKRLSFADYPNVDGLIKFIEDLGVDKFINNQTVDIRGNSVQLFVPGYHINAKRRKVLTADRAINRITFAMGQSIKDQNTIKRRGNSFYNVKKGDIYAEISDYLMKKLPPMMMQSLKEYYEKPFYDRDD